MLNYGLFNCHFLVGTASTTTIKKVGAIKTDNWFTTIPDSP
jgi:hypothetical protein